MSSRILPHLLALFSLAAPACSRAAADAAASPKLVLLIVVDALRADRLGCYGSERATSPAIDRFAAGAVRFTQAFAAAPWTKPSVPSMLTGLPPSRHGVLESGSTAPDGSTRTDVLADEAVTLAEVLSRANYRTAAILKNAQLAAATGLTQGFDVYEEGVGDASAIHARFLEWLEAERAVAPDRPLFAWLHLLDVHWPYRPSDRALTAVGAPPVTGARDLSADAQRLLRDQVNDGIETLAEVDRAEIERLYDGCIRGYDDQFAELVAALEARGLWRDALVVFTSDHGEEFGESGKLGHGHSLSDALLRVPLIVKPAAGAAGAVGEVRDDLVSLLGLLPTIARCAGATAPRALPEQDWFAPHRDAVAVSELLHGATFERAFRTASWRLLEHHELRGSPLAPAAADSHPIERLAPGIRVDVKLSADADGSLDVTQVSLEQGGDDDVEVRGPVATLDADAGTLRIGPFTVTFAPEAAVKLKDAAAVPARELRVGDVVDVDARAVAPFQLEARKLELRPDKLGSTHIKLEALLDAVDVSKRRIALARVRLELADDTRFVGFDSVARVGVNRIPRVLLAGDALDDPALFSTSAQLHRIERGAADLEDRFAREPDIAAKMARQMRALLDVAPALAVGESVVDAETISRLREIGYIK